MIYILTTDMTRGITHTVNKHGEPEDKHNGEIAKGGKISDNDQPTNAKREERGNARCMTF